MDRKQFLAANVAMFHEQADELMHHIKKLLTPDMKLTLVARKPGNDEADIVLTDDDLAEAVKVLQRRGASSYVSSAVPTEPTQAMIAAGEKALSDAGVALDEWSEPIFVSDIWKAMLAASKCEGETSA